MLSATIDRFFDKAGVFEVVGSLARCLSTETLEKVGQTLIRMHRPASFNYAAKFGISQGQPVAVPVVAVPPISIAPEPIPQKSISVDKTLEQTTQQTCRECKSVKLSVLYGKFGYYFKCSDCDSNTPIKISCGKEGHKERIRKDGSKFYRECSDCNSSNLLFVNSVSS